MGWCHEFGPQIHEGCDHPMVAGATSCTCQHCGTQCRGKFAGCVDVWARGPRRVEVRAAASRPQEPRAPVATASNGTAGAAMPAGAAPAPGDGSGRDAMRRMLEELAGRCQALEAVAGRVDALARAQADARAGSEAVAAMGRNLKELERRLASLEAVPARLEALEALASRLAPLEAVPGRLEALEGLPSRLAPVEKLSDRVRALEGTVASQPTDDALAEVATAVGDLAGRLSALEEATPTPAAADQQLGRLAALDKVVAGLMQGRERLAARVQALEAAPVPPASGPDPAELASMRERLEALESAATTELQLPAGLVSEMERLVSRLDALDGAAERLAAVERTTGQLAATNDGAAVSTRLDALDTVVAEVVQAIGELSARLAVLDEAPKRLEALEQSASPSAKILASLTKRVDRLTTHASAVKELPDRVEALEAAASSDQRSEAVAGGLGHAIEMIDQLAHQVAVLEALVPGAKGPSPS